jgi:beta-glucosidase
VRSLAGYQKVTLRAGESRRVSVHVAERQLEHWDTTNHHWRLGTGKRTLWVGPSSQSLPLHTQITISY